MPREPGKFISFVPGDCDREAIRIIRSYLAKQPWVPHGTGRSACIRFALRFSCCKLIEQERRKAKKDRRNGRRPENPRGV